MIGNCFLYDFTFTLPHHCGGVLVDSLVFLHFIEVCWHSFMHPTTMLDRCSIRCLGNTKNCVFLFIIAKYLCPGIICQKHIVPEVHDQILSRMFSMCDKFFSLQNDELQIVHQSTNTWMPLTNKLPKFLLLQTWSLAHDLPLTPLIFIAALRIYLLFHTLLMYLTFWGNN